MKKFSVRDLNMLPLQYQCSTQPRVVHCHYDCVILSGHFISWCDPNVGNLLNYKQQVSFFDHHYFFKNEMAS